MTRVKLCGVTSERDRDGAVAAGADAVGFLVDVSVDSPREIDPEHAETLVDGLPPLVSSVLVTMPESVQDALAVQRRVGADAIQVHSTLSPRYVGGLRARSDASVIAAVGSDADLAAYAEAADALLVDSVDRDGGGGTGETQDWERTRELVAGIDTPIILAGGLTPDNVAKAVETVSPYGVDTASGVESAGGVKDHAAMKRFVRRAASVEEAE